MTTGTAPTATRRFGYLRDPVFRVAVALHLINRFAIRPFTGDTNDFWHCWLNDLVCVPFWLPLLLWLQRGLGLRRHDAPPTVWEIVSMVVLWSLLFEWLVPNTWLHVYFSASVGDPLDVVMYALGAALAGLWWRSGRAGPAIEPPPGPARRQHRVFAGLIVLGTVSCCVLGMLKLASMGLTLDPVFWRSVHLQQMAHDIVAEQHRTGRLPASLSGESWDRFDPGRFEYRPDGDHFALIDLGDDHALGGTGDAEDLWYPPELQPAISLRTWLHWIDVRYAIVAGTLIGLGVTAFWLRLRRRREPPYERLRGFAWLLVLFGIGLPIALAVFVLFLQHGLLVSSQGVH